ncbi:MAG: UPF0147 family protein [Candidatus ainarchaeum sp.]|nr:UPF0147 family protein [Candidatus ainarchaeum sp.]MDD3975835.1 UPF0147 family protein [Candidatus ainarchaeum sp.]
MIKKTKKQEICEKMAKEIIDEADFLLEDHTIPKNVQYVIKNMQERIKKNLCSLEVSSTLYNLEETISNMTVSDCRSSVWNLINKLESLKEKMK